MKQWILIFIFFSLISSVFAETFIHRKPQKLSIQEPLILAIETPDTQEYLIKCFYRFNNEDEFSTIELDALSPQFYQVQLDVIPEAVTLEYFFWIYDQNQYLQSLPLEEPSKAPFVLINHEKHINYFDIISPQKHNQFGEDPVDLFIIRNKFPEYIHFDKAVLNDDPVMIVASSNSLLTLRPQYKLQKGNNIFTIYGKSNEGKAFEETHEIRLDVKPLKRFKYNGSSELFLQSYDTDRSSGISQEPFEMTYEVDVNMDSTKVSGELYALYNNQDSDETQPYSRYRAKFKDPNNRWLFSLGDRSTSFSPLTLSGKRVRGVGMDVDLFGLFSLDRSLRFTILTGITNETIKAASPNVTNGTFEQSFEGYQLKYSGFNSKISAQYLKVEDDESSLVTDNRGTTSPVENHVASLFYEQRFSPVSKLSLEAAGSIYYSDTTAATINVDELDIPDFIESFVEESIPIKSSLSVGGAFSSFFQMPIWSRDTIFKTGFDWIHPGYENIINSSLESDKSEYYVGLNKKLLNKKLILSSEVRKKSDNVIESNTETNDSLKYKVNSIYRTHSYGSLNNTFFITKRDNSFSSDAVASENVYQDNQLTYWMLSMNGIPLKQDTSNAVLNLNYSLSSFSDYIDDSNSSSTWTMGGSLSTQYKITRVNLGLNNAVTNSDLSGKTKYISIYTNTKTPILNDKSYLNIKFKLTHGRNDNDDESYKINNTKINNSIGIEKQLSTLPYVKHSIFYYNIEWTKVFDAINSSDTDANYFEYYLVFKMVNRF